MAVSQPFAFLLSLGVGLVVSTIFVRQLQGATSSPVAVTRQAEQQKGLSVDPLLNSKDEELQKVLQTYRADQQALEQAQKQVQALSDQLRTARLEQERAPLEAAFVLPAASEAMHALPNEEVLLRSLQRNDYISDTVNPFCSLAMRIRVHEMHNAAAAGVRRTDVLCFSFADNPA